MLENKQTSLESTIRKHVLDGKSPNIRKLLLTDVQIALVKRVEKTPLTSSKLSKMIDVSVQNASAMLKRLHWSGYIRIVERSTKTGGLENVYYGRDISHD